MQSGALQDLISTLPGPGNRGPAAILLMEDLTETNSTIRHHLGLGFQDVIVCGSKAMSISPEIEQKITRLNHQPGNADATIRLLNAVIKAMPDRWIYFGYNAEYLFFPFCETRSVGEMTRFVEEERRYSVLTYVIDLYADDLTIHPDGVSLKDAHLDRSGYYAYSRWRDDKVMERQLDMYGGLRWRFEEHIKPEKRRIDRVSLFKARKGLKMRPDMTFNDEDYNTYSNAWHHALTGAVCSFRAAKSLRSNPGSSECIDGFSWNNSEKFNWHSHQLLDLGLMEPGQWF